MPTVADRNNNPGNIRDIKTGAFRKFSSPQEGYAALLNDLQAKQTGTTTTGVGPSSTLADFAKVYAPAGDNNNPAQYTVNLANYMGVRPDAKLSELNLGKWADAVSHAEGYSKAPKSSYNPKPFSSGQIDLTAPDIIPEPKKPEQSFLQEVGGDITGALHGVQEAKQRMQSGELNAPIAVLSGVGSIFGGVGALGATALKGVGGLANEALTHTPVIGKYVQGAENAVGDYAHSVLQSPGVQSAVQGVQQGAQQFSQEYPNISATAGAAGNILSGVTALEGGGMVKNLAVRGLEELAPLAKSVPGVVGRTAQGVVDKKALSEADQILKTPITKKAIATARAENRISPEGTILPSAKQIASEKEVANLVKQGVLSSKLDAAANSGRIGQAADAEAEALESALSQSREVQPVVEPRYVGEALNEARKAANITLQSGEKPLDKLIEVFVKELPTTGTITPVDLLRARKAVGAFVRANKGIWKQDGVLTGFMSARNALWNSTKKLLIEHAPKDIDVAGSLAKQSALYNAEESLDSVILKEIKAAEGAVEKAKNAPNRFVKGIKGVVKATTKTGLGLSGLHFVHHFIPLD